MVQDMYTKKTLEHFINPRNIGEICNYDGIGSIGDPSCGDYLKIYIKVNDNKLVDVKYKVYGCAAAIATTSVLSELALGKNLDEAEQITDLDVAEALGGLPEEKMHCSNLATAALKNAIWDYVLKCLKQSDLSLKIKLNSGCPKKKA